MGGLVIFEFMLLLYRIAGIFVDLLGLVAVGLVVFVLYIVRRPKEAGSFASGNGFGGYMAFFVGFLVFVVLLAFSSLGVALALIVGIAAGVGFHFYILQPQREAQREAKTRAEEQRQRELRARVRQVVDAHLPALLRRRRQLDRTDEYGIRDDSKWIKEINRFCDKVIYPALGQTPPELPRGMKSEPRRYEVDNLVAEFVDEAAAGHAPDFARQFDAAMTPTDYEHFCAERLKLSGWRPTVTQASGDQGADIVASRDGRTIVVQCKHYAKPVGNKAVQEVTAAMRHYSAEAGIVVATNGFTRSAEQLAASNGVTLLGHDDLTSTWALADSY